ncbi:glycosyltransferase family 2 protein [Dyella sp.]|jgi:GT2 family glycosyltransferase|uniref:glycosyltransferase family 2 protein n=1 Tax=Dyella sp. TaxID=1869338 RepID=UPI002D76E84F|nr:glycosyltransferase [Dyella sp.]HET6433213.1 glycosyltransferase [Dyella sp.]
MVHHYAALSRPSAPDCSVCIANFNGEHLLVDCIDSILGQVDGGCIEIIVHDDASTDRSVALLRERYPQVEILASAVNVGFCISNNRMVEHARGTYVLLLNNDAALFPDGLRTLLDAVAAAPDRAAVLTLPQYDWETGILVDRGLLLDPFYNPVPNLDASRGDVGMVIGACLFMPRSLWHALGGLPEWMGSIAEDMFLCCTARLSGARVQVAAASGYRHRQGASFGGNKPRAGKLLTTFRRRQLSERNKTAVLFICTPTSVVWPLLGLHLLFLAIEGVVMALLARKRSIWTEIYGAAIRAVLKDIRVLIRRRSLRQSLRSVSLREYVQPFTLFPHKLRLLYRHGKPVVR